MPVMPRVLEGLKKLTFHEGSFTYAGKSYSYSEIEHVSFTALQTEYVASVGPFVASHGTTTHKANLLLRLSGGRKLRIAQELPLVRSQSASYVALGNAAAIFSEVTFLQRVKAYLNTFNAGKAVAWGSYQITRNGDIFYKN